MAKPTAEVQAAALSVPERVLLFCVASKTEWVRAGVTGGTVIAMTVKGLVERDAAGELTLHEAGSSCARGAPDGTGRINEYASGLH